MTMLRLYSISILVFGLSILTTSLNASSLHAIFVSATNDSSIGEGASKNHRSLLRKLNKIKIATNLNINLIELKERDVHSDKIFRVVQQLETQSDDVIWFYYSGHGINSGRNKWPEFLIAGARPLALDQIHTILKNKPHRLLLTMGDCCNVGEMISTPQQTTPLVAKSKGTNSNNYLVKLFVKGIGHVISCSSSQGEASGYFRNIGGLYTSSFMDALNMASRTEDVSKISWNSIFQETSVITQNMAEVFNKEQIPQYEGSETVRYKEERITISPNNRRNSKHISIPRPSEAIAAVGFYKREDNMKRKMQEIQNAGYVACYWRKFDRRKPIGITVGILFEYSTISERSEKLRFFSNKFTSRKDAYIKSTLEKIIIP